MSEKVPLKEATSNSLLGWALIRAITQKAGSENALPLFGITPGEGELDVELKINGVEVSLRNVLHVWKEERDRLVRRAATHLIEERMGKVSNFVYDLERKLTEGIKEMFPDIYAEGDGENDALDLDLPL